MPLLTVTPCAPCIRAAGAASRFAAVSRRLYAIATRSTSSSVLAWATDRVGVSLTVIPPVAPLSVPVGAARTLAAVSKRLKLAAELVCNSVCASPTDRTVSALFCAWATDPAALVSIVVANEILMLAAPILVICAELSTLPAFAFIPLSVSTTLRSIDCPAAIKSTIDCVTATADPVLYFSARTITVASCTATFCIASADPSPLLTIDRKS